MGISELNLIGEPIARKKRVIGFLNAISDLRQGDLQTELNLDENCPTNLADLPQCDPEVELDGEEFASILEDWLLTVLALGKSSLHSTEEPYQNRRLGNMRFNLPN